MKKTIYDISKKMIGPSIVVGAFGLVCLGEYAIRGNDSIVAELVNGNSNSSYISQNKSVTKEIGLLDRISNYFGSSNLEVEAVKQKPLVKYSNGFIEYMNQPNMKKITVTPPFNYKLSEQDNDFQRFNSYVNNKISLWDNELKRLDLDDSTDVASNYGNFPKEYWQADASNREDLAEQQIKYLKSVKNNYSSRLNHSLNDYKKPLASVSLGYDLRIFNEEQNQKNGGNLLYSQNPDEFLRRTNRNTNRTLGQYDADERRAVKDLKNLVRSEQRGYRVGFWNNKRNNN